MPETPKFEKYRLASLKTYGYSELRGFQEEAFRAISGGRHGLFVVPTGSGKTLTYAIPSLVDGGITIIVSPLIALIRDQQLNLQKVGIACGSFDSLQHVEDQELVWSQLKSGTLTHLIVSPERLSLESFREELKKLPIRLIAVDEAHCISQWGFGFRPEYRNLGVYLREFGSIQIIALTATATQETREEIKEILSLKDPVEIYSPTIRDNILSRVFRFKKENEQLMAISEKVQSYEGSGIVYATTKKKAFELFRMLENAGVSVGLYHGGLTAAQRQLYQKQFINNDIRVMVATSAFGLGVDKLDVRFVFHYGLPSSFEQYVQEIGRAGRDQKQSFACLFYGPKDYYIQKFMIEKESENGTSVSRIDRKLSKLRNIYDFVKCDSELDRTAMMESYFT